MRALLLLGLVVGACAGLGDPTPSGPPLSLVELKYRVIAGVGRPWYCDPDFYPVARADEADLARERLPEMQADAATYAALLSHNALVAGTTPQGDELLAVYRDWKDLRALELGPTGPAGVYGFTFVVRDTDGDKRSERVEGRIDTFGRVSILRREAAGPPNCPICLSAETLIDAPLGPVRVADVRAGDLVWTVDARGQRVAARVLEAASVEATLGHEVVRVALVDGRAVTASPGHPTADGRLIGSLRVGNELDGSTVATTRRLPYRGRTYDLLPSGATGLYWADGILLASTLRRG